MINGRKITEMIHDKLELQATLLLHMFYHARGQGSGDESTHGTLEMHDFFAAGQSVGICYREHKLRSENNAATTKSEQRSEERLYHAPRR